MDPVPFAGKSSAGNDFLPMNAFPFHVANGLIPFAHCQFLTGNDFLSMNVFPFAITSFQFADSFAFLH